MTTQDIPAASFADTKELMNALMSRTMAHLALKNKLWYRYLDNHGQRSENMYSCLRKLI